MKKISGNNKNEEIRFYRLSMVVIAGILLASVIGIFFVFIYANNAKHVELSRSFDWAIDSEENEDIFVKVEHNEPWDTDDGLASQFNAIIVNNTKYSLTDWIVDITVPEGSRTSSMWNGVWMIEGTKATFAPVGVSETVMPYSSQTFGLVMYINEDCDINEVTLTFHRRLSVFSYPWFWICIVVIGICLAAGITVGISCVHMKNYTSTHAAYKDLVNESLRTIANIIDTKDEYTRGHSVRVAIYSKMLAKRMGMSEYDQERIYYIGMLHDIGKIGIPTSILTKPGRLSDEEFEIIKKHTRMGAAIMKDFSSIQGVVDGIRYHHEKYDGGGYNEGLKGEEIPLEGRIICVADSYDAMSSRRCYRNSLDYDYILGELKKNAGKQFDPEIVKHMIDLVEGGYAPVSEAEMEYNSDTVFSD